MMRKATLLAFALALVWADAATAQETEYMLDVPLTEDFVSNYTPGIHSGARGVNGPFDLDGDGQMEVLVTDYTGGGRVHVIENNGTNTWELVYSTPWQDSTATTANARYATGADLDGDGMGEILFISGHGFSEFNENIDDLPLGLYVFEFTGTDDDYGDTPASVLEFISDAGPTPSIRSEQFTAEDVDGDGVQELLIPGNSSNDFDIFYIYSVTGDIGSGFESYNLEAEFNPRSDSDTYGGGSPYAVLPANLDGEGLPELSLHSWNYFNFFNADVAGVDDYLFPQAGGENTHLAATFPDDHVSLFGGAVADIDENGDDEVFYPRFQARSLALLNYEAGEDPLQISEDNFVLDLIPQFSSLGIAAGNLDGDTAPELIGSGPAYSAAQRNSGETPVFLRIANYLGGDVEDPASYEVSDVTVFMPFDTLGAQFDLIRRDSAGVDTTFFRDTGAELRGGRPRGQDPVFVSKLAYLGDADGDGAAEVAAAFQGVDDSTYVIQETWQDTTYVQEIVEARPVENRVFMRIYEFSNFAVAIEQHDVVLPSDYRLSPNYPNPFNPSTTFSFTLPVDKVVSVRVYDVAGRLVQTLVDGRQYAKGTYEVMWDGTAADGAPAASGTYIYTLEYGNFRQSRTMVLVK